MAFDIPLDIRKTILPLDSLSPHHLIHFRTPTNTLPFFLSDNPHVLSRTVSHIVNTTSATVLLAFSVPQPEDLEKLKSIAVEGASVGFISLHYPLPQGGIKLPFWALTYWEELTRVCKGKHQWKGAIEWLKKEHTYDALKILEDTSWDAHLPMCRGSTTLNLVQFCSTEWLSSQHIDIMCAVMNDKLKQNGTIMKILADSPYIEKLISVYRYERESYLTARSSAFLRQLGENLEISNHTHVGFCTSVNIGSDVAVLPGPECEYGNHWTAVVIDTLDRRIFYGDSMGYRAPDELIEVLRWWLQVHTKDDWQVLVEKLPCAVQQDHFSCSIIAINAITHLFDPDAFPLIDSAQDALSARIYYLAASVELAKRLVSQLCYTYRCK